MLQMPVKPFQEHEYSNDQQHFYIISLNWQILKFKSEIGENPFNEIYGINQAIGPEKYPGKAGQAKSCPLYKYEAADDMQ